MSDLPDIVASIKERVHIADLVNDTPGFTVVGRGRVRTTKEHDSLKLWTDAGTWRWFSRAAGGDIFDWYILHHTGADFNEALRELAQRAGVELTPLTPERRSQLDAERARIHIFTLAADYYHQVLLNHPAARPARDYCHQRGWTDATIAAMRLGYVLFDRGYDEALKADDNETQVGRLDQVLRQAKLLDHPAARAVLSLPSDHLVYPHLVGGQARYLSARAISQKRHYNPPEDLAGPRQLYHVPAIAPSPSQGEAGRGYGAHILVEGQADALSLGQLGFDAVALCGLQLSPSPSGGGLGRGELGNVSHVALDNDQAGQARALDLALSLGPLTRVVCWPSHFSPGPDKPTVACKDANDLLRAGATSEAIAAILEESPVALLLLASRARRLKDQERKDTLARLCSAFRDLDDITAADLKPDLAQQLGVSLAHFSRLLKAAEKAEPEKNDKPSPDRYETSPGAAIGTIVFEQCVSWDETGTASCCYAVRGADGKIKKQTSVEAGSVSYVPYPASIDLISKRVIIFPSGPVEYGSQRQLLADIRAFIHRWLDVDPFYEQLASYYVMFTWLYDLFETLPYLRALGDYGTGKSRFLQTVGALCYRPMFVSGASTASPIFRVIDMFKGTLVVDEADFSDSETTNEIIKIINVGYSKGGIVLRAEKDENSDTYYPSAKEVYGPKILATRKLFQDRATESRCLTKRMSTAKPRPDIKRVIGPDFWRDALDLRNRLLLYRLRNYHAVEINHDLSDQSIEPRLDQVTLALKTMVDDEDMRQQISTFVRAYNQTLISDRQMSLPAIVVQALANIFYDRRTNILGEDLRDWTMKGIAEKAQDILNDIDPETHLYAKQISKVLSEELGLTRRGKHPDTRRDMLLIEEDELLMLMARYGIERPGDPPTLKGNLNELQSPKSEGHFPGGEAKN